MAGELRILPTLVQDPSDAMALDESLLVQSIENSSPNVILRFYRFSEKCVTIGLSQRHPEFLTMVNEMGYPWVRRPTGGGMVVHQNDLIMSLIAPVTLHSSLHQARTSYRIIHDILREAFNHLGVETSFNQGGCQADNIDPQLMICFERPICDDLMKGKRKVAGGAQRRSRGYILHQGALLTSVIAEDKVPQLECAIAEGFGRYLSLSVAKADPTEEELSSANQLHSQKYVTPEWNWRVRTLKDEEVRFEQK